MGSSRQRIRCHHHIQNHTWKWACRGIGSSCCHPSWSHSDNMKFWFLLCAIRCLWLPHAFLNIRGLSCLRCRASLACTDSTDWNVRHWSFSCWRRGRRTIGCFHWCWRRFTMPGSSPGHSPSVLLPNFQIQTDFQKSVFCQIGSSFHNKAQLLPNSPKPLTQLAFHEQPMSW